MDWVCIGCIAGVNRPNEPPVTFTLYSASVDNGEVIEKLESMGIRVLETPKLPVVMDIKNNRTGEVYHITNDAPYVFDKITGEDLMWLVNMFNAVNGQWSIGGMDVFPTHITLYHGSVVCSRHLVLEMQREAMQ